MKKSLCLIFSMLMVLSLGIFLCACGPKKPQNNETIDTDNIDITLTLPKNNTYSHITRTKTFSQDLSSNPEIDFCDINLINGANTNLNVLANVVIEVEKEGQETINYSNWFNIDEELVNTADLTKNSVLPSEIDSTASDEFCLENLLLSDEICTTYSNAKITTQFTFVYVSADAGYNIDQIIAVVKDESDATIHTLTLNVDGTEIEYALTGGSSIEKALDSSDIYQTYNLENTCGFFMDNEFVVPLNKVCLWKDTTLYTKNATTEGFTISDDGELIIADSTTYSGEICLPAQINGIALKVLPANAFKGNTNITNITLPGSVRLIGQQAFRGCNGLTSIVLPYGVETLDVQAFALCSELTDVILPDTIKTIDQYCFASSAKLANINLPNSIETINIGAFYKTGLTHIVVPGSLKNMGQYIFRECSALQTAVILEGLTTIPYGLFFRCPALTSVELPEGITEICDGAFNICSSLQTINFPSTLVEIKKAAFQSTAITDVVLPEGFKKLGIFVFDECTNLRTAQLPSTLEEIGKCAFQKCTQLEEVNLPSSLKFIGDFGFNHCSSLNFSTIVIPASVIQLGGETFVGDNEDNDIIGSHMFYNCATASLTSFEVEEGNTHFVAKDGVLYTKNFKYLIAYPAANTRTSYDIEDGCELAYELAFSRAHYLQTLKLPNSFEVIPANQLPDNWVNTDINSLSGGIYVYTSISAFEVNDDNPNFKAVDGILYSKDGTKVVAIPTRKWDSNKVLYFSDDMTTIDTTLVGVNATNTYNGHEVGGCPSIIVLSENVTNIVENGFYELSGSTKIFTELTTRPEGWATNLGINENRIYYYSDIEQSGNYWHYVNEVPTAW